MGRKKLINPIESPAITQEISEKLASMANQTMDEQFLERDSAQLVELIQAERMSKKLKTEIRSIKNISREEIKMLVKLYYQLQDNRIALRNQERSIEGPEPDETKETGNIKILDFLVKNMTIMEVGVKETLQIVAENSEVGRWLLSITGIGPILAAGLLAYFDVSKCQYASQFISYAGLNDNNRPWIGNIGATKIFDELVAKYNPSGKKKFEISDEFVTEFSNITQWKYGYLVEHAYNQEKKKWDKAALIAAASKIPYNKELKKLCWKIGKSFAWQINNEKSVYGRLLVERRAIELQHNEAGDYASQAERALEKNIGKETIAYKNYSKGQLPLAHINARAQRFAVKVFLVHLFECMYRVHHKDDPNGNLPPAYYALEHSDGLHNKYIESEVAYPC